MAELNFPASPVMGQEYLFNNLLYKWDGEKWTTWGSGTNSSLDLRNELATNAGAAMVGTASGLTVQEELDLVGVGTSLEPLRRTYADAGFRLDVNESFAGGGTLTAADEVLLGSGLIGWSWDGAFPKEVPPGSTPETAGGIGPGAWIDQSRNMLREQITSMSGVLAPEASWTDVPANNDPVLGSANGPMNAQAEALAARTELLRIEASYAISVLNEGANADSTNGLDGTDSTAAFLSAIAKCKDTGKALRIPTMLNGYRLTAPIDVRGVNVLDSACTLYINHPGIGVIFGGNASDADNPTQYLGTVIRVTGIASQDTPDMRGIGIKGQHIHVEHCDYVQIYADDNADPAIRATDYSCAYSSFFFKKVSTIELYGTPGTLGWINENKFYLNRTSKILFAFGDYHHNHNKFFGGNMEGPGIIDLQVGSSNYFYDFRFERNPSDPSQILTINFAEGTWNNIVEATWISSRGYTNEPYNRNNLVQVTDLGGGNSVCHAQERYTNEATIFDLSPSTPFMSYTVNGGSGTHSKNTDMHGVRFIKHLVNGKFKCTADFGEFFEDDRLYPVRNGDMFSFASDVQIFRINVYLYDTTGALITTEPTYDAIDMPSKVWSNGGYSLNGNVAITSITIASPNISAIKLVIRFGNAADGLLFTYARFTARQYKQHVTGARKIFDLAPPKRKTALSYSDSSFIDMADIAEQIPCYKNDLSEMKINHIRQRYVVAAVAGNTITTLVGSVQYFDLASCFVAYTNAANDNVMVAVSGISGQVITLSAPVPAEIVVGSNIDFIVTKTKTLA